MKMNLNIKIIASVFLALFICGTWSCKKMLDVAPEDTLDSKNAYRNVNDADAAVLGIYGQFLGL